MAREKETPKKTDWLRSTLLAVLMFILITRLAGTTLVINQSMLPTLQERDMLILWKLGANIGRGDIVVFESHLKLSHRDILSIDPVRRLLVKEGDPKPLIKRVIGMPGETVEIREGMIYIDGTLLDESHYYKGLTPGEMEAVRIPPGSYFLMGDNRNHSIDSRDPEVGLVLREAIMGKVLLRYWPIAQFSFF